MSALHKGLKPSLVKKDNNEGIKYHLIVVLSDINVNDEVEEGLGKDCRTSK